MATDSPPVSRSSDEARDQVLNEAQEWYDHNVSSYKALCDEVLRFFKEKLVETATPHLYVIGRIKSKERFLRKILDRRMKKSDYSHLSVRDVAGIRIITRLRSEKERVGDLIIDYCDPNKHESARKEHSLHFDQFGYSATNWVVRSKKGSELSKWLGDMKNAWFEIQVCSVLEHGWAENEHGGYEISEELSNELKRRYALLAAQVEAADREFDKLAAEVANWIQANHEVALFSENRPAEQVDTSASGKSFGEINGENLLRFLKQRFSNLRKMNWDADLSHDKKIMQEISDMGITTIEKFNSIIDEDFDKLNDEYRLVPTNIRGLIRSILVIHDASGYFEKAWKGGFSEMNPGATAFWKAAGVDMDLVERYVKASE